MKRDEVHLKEIAARKVEKIRIKQLRELQKILSSIAVELYQVILDSETV
jgi:hypothetical protein